MVKQVSLKEKEINLIKGFTQGKEVSITLSPGALSIVIGEIKGQGEEPHIIVEVEKSGETTLVCYNIKNVELR
jgi:hypothetical protein